MKAFRPGIPAATACLLAAFAAPAGGQEATGTGAAPANGEPAGATPGGRFGSVGAPAVPAADLPRSVLARAARQDDPGSPGLLGPGVLEFLHADHPVEALNILAGVNFQITTGREYLPAIRSPVLVDGAARGSILLLENGLPTRGAAFGAASALQETLFETAELIEVVAGPGSARNGSNALHGVINVVGPAPKADLAYRASAFGNIEGRFQLRSVGFGLIPGARSVLTLSGLFDDGWRGGTGLNVQKGAFALAREIGGWELYSYAAGTRLDQLSAGPLVCDANDPACFADLGFARSNPTPGVFRRAWSARVNFRAAREFSGGRFSIVPYSVYQGAHSSLYELPGRTEERDGQYLGGLRLRYEHSIGPVAIDVGLDGEGGEAYLSETQLAQITVAPGSPAPPMGTYYDHRVASGLVGGHFEFEARLGRYARLSAGLRAEGHFFGYRNVLRRRDPPPVGTVSPILEIADRSDSFALVTPRAGLVLSGWREQELFVDYSSGGRVPQIGDAYRLRAGQNPGAFGPETIHAVEAGGRGTFLDGQLGYVLTGYWMAKSGVHFRAADDRDFAGGSTVHYGIDTELFGSLGPFRAGLTVSWGVHNYDFDLASDGITRGARIPQAPEWLVDFTIGYYSRRFSARADIEFVSPYFRDTSGRTYDGHNIIKLRGNWLVSERAEVFVVLRNLLGALFANRADFASGSNLSFPGEPFAIGLGLRFTHDP